MKITSPRSKKGKVLLVALYPEKIPSIGESHALSVLAGCLEKKLENRLDFLEVLDMVAFGENQTEKLQNTIENKNPNIIGFSVTCGGYSILKAIFPTIITKITAEDNLILFGGAIATYIPEVLLRTIYPKGYVVIGEGDEAIVTIVNRWLQDLSIESVPNICFLKNDKVVFQKRKLVDTKTVPPPFRKHLSRFILPNSEIYTEASRGCPWCKCTFCLRGLTDFEKKPTEYRRFAIERLRNDLTNLDNSGFHTFTFADENFLGGNEQEDNELISGIEEIVAEEKLDLCFDVSIAVNSIYSSKWDPNEIEIREEYLKRLKNIGLRKVFIGAESTSPSQLKRYVKGHTPHEILAAVNLLRANDIAIEVGIIMFDPLCTLDELEENISFLIDNGLAACRRSQFLQTKIILM